MPDIPASSDYNWKAEYTWERLALAAGRPASQLAAATLSALRPAEKAAFPLGERRVTTSHPPLTTSCCSGLWEVEEESNPEQHFQAWASLLKGLRSPPTNQPSSALRLRLSRESGDPGPAQSRGWARPPVVAMAAAGSNVVRRVEELGDLAQAHIQQLSEAAGEDGEGAEEREAGGRTVVQSWHSPAVSTGSCGLWSERIPGQSYRRC